MLDLLTTLAYLPATSLSCVVAPFRFYCPPLFFKCVYMYVFPLLVSRWLHLFEFILASRVAFSRLLLRVFFCFLFSDFVPSIVVAVVVFFCALLLLLFFPFCYVVAVVG